MRMLFDVFLIAKCMQFINTEADLLIQKVAREKEKAERPRSPVTILILMSFGREYISEGHPVLDILRRGPKRKERLGLVLEGGGMRGSVVAGAALALEQLGLRSTFSACYGSSAGAIAAAYFMSGQATWGTSIFYDELMSEEFFSWKRVSRGKSPLSLDFLFNEIMMRVKPLRWEDTKDKVYVFASHAKSGELHGWNQWQSQEDLLGALRASATLPLLAGGPYSYRGEDYFDAGIHTPVPWKEALSQETHLLVLLSRPENEPRPPVSRIDGLLARNFFARRYPQLLPLHLRTVDRYNKSLEKLRLLQKEGRVLVVSPPSARGLPKTMDRDRQRVQAGIRTGAESLYRELFGRVPQLDEMIVSSEGGKPLWKEEKPSPSWWF